MEQLTFDPGHPIAVAPRSGCRIYAAGRECSVCREYKSWAEFHISRTIAYGHVTACKVCLNIKVTALRQARRAAAPPKPPRPAICRLDKCGGKIKSAGLCSTHYERQRQAGDPRAPKMPPAMPARADLPGEIWKPIPTYEGLYEVSNMGRVYSLPHLGGRGRALPGRFMKGDHGDPRGYVRHGLVRPGSRKQQKHSLHRLILWAFTGENPPDLQTRHLDGDASNNTLANLAWGTVSENALDRVRHGTWVNNNRFVNATSCINGHEFDEANTYWRPGGGRSCKACARDKYVARRDAARSEAKEAA